MAMYLCMFYDHLEYSLVIWYNSTKNLATLFLSSVEYFFKLGFDFAMSQTENGSSTLMT
jgi:hypothetical protein